MKIHNIGISCIGSGIGQSVINSCRLSPLPIRTVGFGNNPFAYGLYDCDSFDYVPPIYQPDYVDVLIKKCKEHHIDLLIPGLDDETLFLSRSLKRFEEEAIEVIVAGEDLLSLCRDKERMSRKLGATSNVFVKSYSKDSFLRALKKEAVKLPVIAKPKGGFASRGIKIIRHLEEIYQMPEDCIIQELAVPHSQDTNRDFYIKQLGKGINAQVSEISVQLVADKNGDLIGRMASCNKLSNGIPIEIIPFENEIIWQEIDALYPVFKKLGLRGPLNLQGRITDEGFKIFELNARFTGITGLRALMGFNEVESCIKHWLNIGGESDSLQLNHYRFGVRLPADKSIPVERNNQAHHLFNRLNERLIKKQKILLVTGATGYLGRSLVAELVKDGKYEIWVLSRNTDKAKEALPYPNVRFYDQADFKNGTLSFSNIDIIIHGGFARPHLGNKEIADSLVFTGELFTRAVMNHLPAIINISSQSVYGLEHLPPWKENQPAAPSSPYAQAKYAAEIMLQNFQKMHKPLFATSLRLASLAGGKAGLVTTDFVSKFAYQALKGEAIKITGGRQQMERLDVRDAVSGICRLIETPPENWKHTYNLGAGKTYNIVEIAQIAVEAAGKYNSGRESEIIVEERNIEMSFGMDISSFTDDMQWKPAHDIKATINSLIKYYALLEDNKALEAASAL